MQQITPGGQSPLDRPLIQGDSRKVINQGNQTGNNVTTINERYQNVGIGALQPSIPLLDGVALAWQMGAAMAVGITFPALFHLLPSTLRVLALALILIALVVGIVTTAIDKRTGAPLAGYTALFFIGGLTAFLIDMVN